MTWAIVDFFERLKDQSRNLRFKPFGSDNVKDIWVKGGGRNKAVDPQVLVLQRVYRKHRWPDLEWCRERECPEAVKKGLDKIREQHWRELDREDQEKKDREAAINSHVLLSVHTDKRTFWTIDSVYM